MTAGHELKGVAHAEDAAACPMHVADTSISAMDVPGGITLTFTTYSGNIARLRHYVRRLTAMHRWAHEGQAGTAGMPHRHEWMHGHGHGMMTGPHGWNCPYPNGGEGIRVSSEAVFEGVPGGARIVFTPVDPARLDELRAAVRAQAERMQAGECFMGMRHP
jgi:hypothetical protein